MQSFKSFLDQSLRIWQDSTGAARIGIILLALICIGATVGVGIWSAQPSYVVLRDDIPAEKMQAIVAALNQANIKFQPEGTTIYVDRRKLNDAEIIALGEGLANSRKRFEPNPTDIWTDPRARAVNDRHNLERQIAHMVEKIHSIEQAEIVLSLPPREPFARLSKPPRASVTITISPTSRFDDSSAASIASLVANAVIGLSIEHVSIADTNGIQYETDDSYRQLTTQEQHRIRQEQRLASQAQEMLVKTLGFGNAIVKVNAVYDYPDARIKSTKFDLEGKYKTSESIETKTQNNGNTVAQGGAGTFSNNGGGTGSTAGISNDSKTEILESTTAAPTIHREEYDRTPKLESMTVSVMVNSKDIADADQGALQLRYENIVKNAIGFRESTDSITVEFFPFVSMFPEDELVAAPFPWEQIHKILKNISLGLAGLVALLLGIVAFRKMTPVVATEPEPVSHSRETQIGQLSDLVKQNPEIFSQIISAWSTTSPDMEAPGDTEPGVARQAA